MSSHGRHPGMTGFLLVLAGAVAIALPSCGGGGGAAGPGDRDVEVTALAIGRGVTTPQGLDVVSTRTVREVIRRFKEQGRCVILSTHHMDEVERLCDRVAVVHRGKSLQRGTPQELTQAYQADSLETAFVKIIGAQALLEEAEREAKQADKRKKGR